MRDVVGAIELPDGVWIRDAAWSRTGRTAPDFGLYLGVELRRSTAAASLDAGVVRWPISSCAGLARRAPSNLAAA